MYYLDVSRYEKEFGKISEVMLEEGKKPRISEEILATNVQKGVL